MRITSHPVHKLDNRRTVNIFVNDRSVKALAGETLAAALWANGFIAVGHNCKTGLSRGLYCGIGHCYECRVVVDGMEDIRSCLVPVREGMRVRLPSPTPGSEASHVD